MKIVKLQVENIKKLKAIEVVPDGNMVIISGENEQGKTTVLDSIWWAIGGTKQIQDEPLRAGQKKGKITLDLGDMIATRKFTESGSTLEVTNKDGLKFPSPQAVLDRLISRFSFDIQEFANTKDGKAQVDTLLSIVTIPIDPKKLEEISGVAVDEKLTPLDMLNKAYKAVFDERTAVNRELDKAKKKLDGMQKSELVEQVLITDLVAEKDALEKINRENEKERTAVAVLKEAADDAKLEVEDAEKEIQRAQDALDKAKSLKEKLEKEYKQAVADHAKTAKKVSQLEDKDLTDINAKIANADETNRKAQAYADYQDAAKAKDDSQEEANSYTAKLEAIKSYKDELMNLVNFPIEGLGFANGGVTYQDLPFSQASGAQRLQVSTAIGMALNSELRVLRFNDGNQLDSKHLAIIKKMAKEKDYQIWMEVVDESGKVGIVIEDGTVKSANKETEAV